MRSIAQDLAPGWKRMGRRVWAGRAPKRRRNGSVKGDSRLAFVAVRKVVRTPSPLGFPGGASVRIPRTIGQLRPSMKQTCLHMRRRMLLALGAAAVTLAACGGDGGATSWALEAQDMVDAIEAAYDDDDPVEAGRLFANGGSLDFETWRMGVARRPIDAVALLERLIVHEEPRSRARADFDADHIFLSRDQAVVWWYGYDNEGTTTWTQTFSFDGSAVSSRAFRAVPASSAGFVAESEQNLLDLRDRYFDAWGAADPEALATVYAADITSSGALTGFNAAGIGALQALGERSDPIEPGPAPGIFMYRSGDHIEAILVVQVDGACPALEARRWVLAGELIAAEERYVHIESGRRCHGDPGDGWWSDFELPPSLEDNVTARIDVNDETIDLLNARADHIPFARWLFARFDEAGIDAPALAAIRVPPSRSCTGRAGLATQTESYEQYLVVICFTEEQLPSDRSESGWKESVTSLGLHELAHVWMLQSLDDTTRAAFLDRTGLTSWFGTDLPWRERGVEQAAFTIAWGLGGNRDARYPIFPIPACAELQARYELLTGGSSITTCGDGGWTP